MRRLRLHILFCCVAIAMLTATSAHADFITAYGWRTIEANVNSGTGATAATLGSATCHNGAGACTFANADVTFTTTGVNFSATGATIAAWIASNTFPINNLTNTVGAALMDPTIWEFVGNISVTGTAGTPESFTISHDDGATFVVNGQTVVNHPGPTSPIVTTGSYTGGVNGNAPFDLIYTECCGGPAVLSVSLLAPSSAPVPEPGSALLLLTACAGAGVLARRKLRMNQAAPGK